MRAGKRVDTFPNSYSGDPLAAYRLNIAKAGWPSWNFLDSGPEAMMIAPPLDPEEEEADEQTAENPDEVPEDEAEVDQEAASAH